MTLTVVGETNNPLTDYLEYLYGGNTGVAYTALKRSDGTFSQQFFSWPDSSLQLQQHIVSQAGYGEVYIAPALFKSESSLKESVSGSQVVWCEFDGNAPASLNELPDGIPAPSLRIQSSEPGHEHWYWKLDSFTDDINTIERINRALAYHLGADASGWDANQILRPPTTFNHKRNKPVGVLTVTDATYPATAFVSWEAPERLNEQLINEVIPDAFEVAMRYAWPTQALELYRSKPTVGPSPEFPTGRSGAIMQLAYFACEMGMSNAEVYSIIRNADDRWGKFKDRTDRDRRLLDIISVARIKHPVGEDTLDPANPLDLMGFEEVLHTEIQLEWTIEGLLQLAGSMIMTGLPGVGKTQLSLRFVINLALGRDFLGFKITRPHRIIFFSLEMGLADLKYFLSIMAPDLTAEDLTILQENLKFIPYGEALYLDKEPVQKKVEKLIKDFKPDGVVYDSMGSTTADELSSESVVKAITDWDARIRKNYNVFSWFIHHQRKAQAQNKKPKTLSDLYGNQYIAARATSVYCLWSEGGSLELLCLKKRLSRMDEPIGIERTGTLNFIRGNVDLNFDALDMDSSPVAVEDTSEDKLPSVIKDQEGGPNDMFKF